METFQALKLQNLVPDVITYNAMVSAFEKGSQAERAMDMFQALKLQHLVPNVITYSVMVCAFEKGS